MFQSLCKVEADITGAPYTSTLAATGRMGYKRSYEVILLVGLTELKAQVSWIDERTVRAHIILYISIYLIRFLYARIQGTEKRFVATPSEFLLRLNATFRSNAVVVYDDYL